MALFLALSLSISACGNKNSVKDIDDKYVNEKKTEDSTISTTTESTDDNNASYHVNVSDAVTPAKITSIPSYDDSSDYLGDLECTRFEKRIFYLFNDENNHIDCRFIANSDSKNPAKLVINNQDVYFFDSPLEKGREYIFSVTYYISDYKSAEIYIETDGKKSNVINLFSCDPQNGISTNEVLEKIDDIEKLDDEFAGNGFVDPDDREKVLSIIEKEAISLMNEGIVIEERKSDDHVYMRFNSGLEYIYTPPQEGVKATSKELSVYTYQPFADEEKEMHLPTEQMDNVASFIDESFDDIIFADNIDDGRTNRQNVKDYFSVDQVIIWDGHGGFDEVIGAYLLTGEAWSRVPDLAGLEPGLILTNDGVLAISADFFDNSFGVGSLNNTLIILNACHTAQYTDTKKLAQTLLNKGATAVVGFSDTVKLGYANNVVEYMLEKMCQVDEDTNDYYTAYDALCYAAGAYGIDDSIQYNGIGAAPVYFGDTSYRFSTAIDNIRTAEIPDGVYDTALGPAEPSDTFDLYGNICGNLYSAYYDKEKNTFFVNGGFVNAETGEIIRNGEYELPCSPSLLIQAYGGEDDENGNPVYYEETPDAINLAFTEDKNAIAQSPMADISGFGFEMTINNGCVEKIFLFGS